MPKPKVETIHLGLIYGDYQELFINGNKHSFNIYWSPMNVLEELERYYDFSYLDRKDLEVMW